MEQSGKIPGLHQGFGLRSSAAQLIMTGLLSIVVVAPAVFAGEPPATRPSVRARDRDASIRRAFRELADAKPSAREEARSWLLSLSREDLPALREAVKRGRPLAPGQVAGLREIVTHVYLRSDPYDRELSNQGFLGVMFRSEIESAEPESGGVEIHHCMPGFCAFQSLQDGDVIRAVVGAPSLMVHTTSDVISAIGTCHAGDTVVLEVLRDARLIRVPIVLDPRPTSIGGNDARTAGFLSRRQADADTYWDENFETLVSERVS